VVTINDHGDDEGNFVNQDFIKEKLAELSAKIRVYNQLEANEEKVKRVKLNLKTCYGDACITTSLLEIIRTFTDDGIEVRTSAIKGDSTSSSIVGNGKNYADADDTKTVIVERLFTSSKPDAENLRARRRQNIKIFKNPST